MLSTTVDDGGLCVTKPHQGEEDVQASERLRVQELLRYFQPSVATELPDKARVATDPALTAFAQLCAWKLNCQRSFISLMDHESQHIIAEATRTVSLETEDVHDGDDEAIYLGTRKLDLHWGVCPNTIKLFTSTDGSLNVYSRYVKATKSYYVMNDLSKIPEYESRPYVAGWPFMKYYAEVPIHSPSGYTIGTLCVVDDKARDGLDMKGLNILKEIATAVMDHLDLVVSKVQRKRAERMINGLGIFVESTGNVRQWWSGSELSSPPMHPAVELSPIRDRDRSKDPRISLEGAQDASDSSSKADSQDTRATGYFVIEKSLTEPSSLVPSLKNYNLEDTVETIDPKADFPISLPGASNPNMLSNGRLAQHLSRSESWKTSETSASKDVKIKPTFFSDLEETLSRATDLIREAIDLDGVVFFDPGSLKTAESDLGSPGSENPRATLDAEQGTLESLNLSHVTHDLTYDPQIRLSKVLASSTRNSSDRFATNANPLGISEAILHRFVSMFNRGGVLKFDRQGLATVNELELSWYINGKKPRQSSNSSEASETQIFIEPDWKDSIEVQELRRLLPDVSAIILFPIWNSGFDKLICFNVAWTVQATRVFQREDFAYIASFGNLIMAELSRLDIVAADRAKTDFISSISHELRSPLHGVLASAELLKELVTDPMSIDIINTIEACGSTLLDSLTDLLTFAKINNFTVKERERRSTLQATSKIQTNSQAEDEGPLNLASLVEDVVNASISGHQYRKALEGHSSGSQTSSNQVSVICDIEPQRNWIFDSQIGAWKRIVLNLLGNSLKYTTSGYIHIRLEQIFSASDSLVSFTIEDSGKGISEKYLTYDLFKPFRQENSLSPGTGLGLSIVHQLVTSIDGKVAVTSKVGTGTKVTITVPLKPSVSNEIDTSNDIISTEALAKLCGLKIGFVNGDKPLVASASTRSSRVMESSLLRCANGYFGLGTSTVSSISSNSVDILLVSEAEYQSEKAQSIERRKHPVIVLSANLTLDYRSISDDDGPIIYLSQPFGPRKFARALEACLPFLNGPSHDTSDLKTVLDTSKSKPPNGTVEMIPIISAPLMTPPIEKDAADIRWPLVLLVEDNLINLKLLVAYMNRIGVPSVTATNGLEAINKYQEFKGAFGMIFMDIQMPVMDGMKASYAIREFERRNSLNRTKIVALTGLGSTDAQEEAKLNGVDMFLTKPVPLKSLKEIIEDNFPFQSSS